MNPKKHFGYSCVLKWIPEKPYKVLPVSFWKRSSVFPLRIPSEGPLPFAVVTICLCLQKPNLCASMVLLGLWELDTWRAGHLEFVP